MSTKRLPVAEYFRDAPYFRTFEGIVGAKYHVKANPLGPGLWFADRELHLTIAQPREMNPDRTYGTLDDLLTDYPASEDDTLERYSFETVRIEPGDAVIDEILFLPQRMRDAPYEEYQDGGALIRFTIPREKFHAAYEYDDVQRIYRAKPYQLKFATEDTILETADSIEPVKQYSTARLSGGELTIDSVSPFAGSDERVIGGQSVFFYVKEAFNILGKPVEPGAYVLPLLSTNKAVIDGELRYPNPYIVLKQQFDRHAALFDEAKIFSPSNQAEFKAHRADIEKRFEYFEAHPFT